jgi:hypothetical protein
MPEFNFAVVSDQNYFSNLFIYFFCRPEQMHVLHPSPGDLRN